MSQEIFRCGICRSPMNAWIPAPAQDSNPTADSSERSWRSPSYYRCPECGLVRKHPFPPIDAERKRYELHSNAIDDPDYRAYMTAIVNAILRPMCSGGEHILDYGCGPAPMAQSCIANTVPQAEVCSYDPLFFPDALHHCANLNSNPDKENAHCPPQFDIIFCNEAAEHFFHPIDEFRSMKALLKTGGWIVLGTGMAPRSAADFSRWWYIQDTTHVHFYNWDSLRRISEELSLEVGPYPRFFPNGSDASDPTVENIRKRFALFHSP